MRLRALRDRPEHGVQSLNRKDHSHPGESGSLWLVLKTALGAKVARALEEATCLHKEGYRVVICVVDLSTVHHIVAQSWPLAVSFANCSSGLAFADGEIRSGLISFIQSSSRAFLY